MTADQCLTFGIEFFELKDPYSKANEKSFDSFNLKIIEISPQNSGSTSDKPSKSSYSATLLVSKK